MKRRGRPPVHFGPPKPEHLRDHTSRGGPVVLRIVLGKKLCSGCGVWRSEYMFHVNTDTASRLEYRCNECRADAYERVNAAKRALTQQRREADTDRQRRHEQALVRLRAARRRQERKRRATTVTGRNAERRRRQRECEQLRDRYVRKQLKNEGYPSEVITPEMVEVKRVRIAIARMERDLRQQLKEQHSEELGSVAGRDERAVRQRAQRRDGTEDRQRAREHRRQGAQSGATQARA